jgi:ferric-dicitrate binding protein FerR (iron transport regulator)
MFAQDMVQITTYAGIDRLVLMHFLRRAESLQPFSGKIRPQPASRKETHFMFKRPVWALATAALVILLLGTFVFAQPVRAEATLVVAEGQAIVTQTGRTFLSRQVETAVSAGEIIALHRGDTIELGTTSTAQLRLQDGSTVDLFGGTTLVITELITSENSYQVQLDMISGRTINRVVRLLQAGDRFEVRTPSSTASVRGTVFTVEVISPETTYISVAEGVVLVTVDDQQADVKAGHEVTATISQPLEVTPQEEVEPAIPPNQGPGNPPEDVPGNSPAGGGEPPGGPPDQVPGNPPEDVPGNPPDGGGEPPGGPPDQVPGNPPDDVPGNPPDGGGDPPGGPPDDPPGGGNGNGNGNGNPGGKPY